MTAPIGLPQALGTLLPQATATSVTPSVSVGQVGQTPIAGASGASNTTPFADRVRDLVAQTDDANRVAETMATDFAEGKSNDIHGTMIAMQKADVTFRLLANVRNRAIEAYHEVMRMGA